MAYCSVFTAASTVRLCLFSIIPWYTHRHRAPAVFIYLHPPAFTYIHIYRFHSLCTYIQIHLYLHTQKHIILIYWSNVCVFTNFHSPSSRPVFLHLLYAQLTYNRELHSTTNMRLHAGMLIYTHTSTSTYPIQHAPCLYVGHSRVLAKHTFNTWQAQAMGICSSQWMRVPLRPQNKHCWHMHSHLPAKQLLNHPAHL